MNDFTLLHFHKLTIPPEAGTITERALTPLTVGYLSEIKDTDEKQ